jgi:RNA polymerase sigma-70 factor, ECF subfamily
MDIEAFLRGEPAQLAAIQRAIQGTIRSFHFGYGDIERDLVQEALSRTLAGVSAGRFQGNASLETYARNVARYTCLEHIRRRRHEVALDPESLTASERWAAPEESFLSSEEHRLNLEAFASLPVECQDVLRMICLDGSSYREVATRLGISEATLKSRVHRCRLTCRRAVKTGSRLVRLALRSTL